jgi:hypothetical protein
MQVANLKFEAISASNDFSSRIRQLETENGLLKQQLLQQQQQQQQHTLQAAANAHSFVSSDQKQLHEQMKALELAYAEQQKLSAVASAAQSECNLLQQHLKSSHSMLTALQGTADRQQRQIEQQQQHILELQSHIEKERVQAAATAARASAAESENFQNSQAAMLVAAASQKELEEQQETVLHLRDLLQNK